VRIRTALAGHVVALDMFNTAAAPPPRLGETIEISFASADVLLTAD